MAQRMAAALGTTEADAVVRLALMGAGQYEREERLARLARERRESVLRAAPGPAVSYPPAEEARQVVLDAREE